MPFNGHLVITDAIGKGLITLVSALGGARPIFVFTMTAQGGDLREIPKVDMALKLLSASMVVAAMVIISVG